MHKSDYLQERMVLIPYYGLDRDELMTLYQPFSMHELRPTSRNSVFKATIVRISERSVGNSTLMIPIRGVSHLWHDHILYSTSSKFNTPMRMSSAGGVRRDVAETFLKLPSI